MLESVRVYVPAVYETVEPIHSQDLPLLAQSAKHTGVGSLQGKSIAIIDNCKLFELGFGDILAEQLVKNGASDVIYVKNPVFKPATEDVLDDLAGKVSAAITGLGNCGSCTTYTTYDGAGMTKRGIYSATLVIPQFLVVATAAAAGLGVAEHPIFPLREDVDFVARPELEAEAARVAGTFMGAADRELSTVGA